MVRQLKKKKIIILVVLFASISFFVFSHRFHNNYIIDDFSTEFFKKLTINDTYRFVPGQVCIHPNLPLHTKELSPFFYHIPAPKCEEEKNWVEVKNGSFFVTEEAIERHGNIKCDYSPILRDGDFNIKYGHAIKSIKSGTQIVSDHFKVECSGSDGKSYSNMHSAIRLDKSIHMNLSQKHPQNSVGLSILMIGFDSVSRLTWMRKLPLTYKYFTEVLIGRELKGYNIIGDGTPAALIPILTGHTIYEVPNALQSQPGAKPVDDYPFIWKDFIKNGFMTQYAEDQPNLGTFTYRMLGFKNQPVDHYMRPFYLAAQTAFSQHKPFCMGSEPRHKIMLDVFKDTFDMYGDKPKFSFGFMSEICHSENNMLSFADEDLRDFLIYMNERGHLNKTLLILMSDHGARFNHFRETGQGKLEERMPFFGLRFPKWFQTKFPNAMKNVKTNIHRLTTPFDIHATFQDILNFTGAGHGDISRRAISLFKEVPLERSCAHADIEPHWCACLNWKDVDTNDIHVAKSIDVVIEDINNRTQAYRGDCEVLKLDKITSSKKYSWNQDTLQFRNFIGDPDTSMTDTVKATEEMYQVTFCVVPGNGCFEATVKYHFERNIYKSSKKEISRINKYGNAPACILKKNSDLRPFCYCKNQLNL